jgi:putative ABC transport system permease protein
MFDIFNEIIGTLKQNKLRTSLTGFAVAWGVFMLITLLGAGNGLLNALLNNNQNLDMNTMRVFGGMTSKAYNGINEGTWTELKEFDAERTGNSYKNVVDAVTEDYWRSDTASFEDLSNIVSINGASPITYAAWDKTLIAGRKINELDVKEHRKVIFIGDDAAGTYLPAPADSLSIIGKYIKVGSLLYKVIGIFQSESGSDQMEMQIPTTTFIDVYPGSNINSIVFTYHGLYTEKANEDFMNQYKKDYNIAHGYAPDDDRTLWISNSVIDNITINKVINIINITLWIIGLFTLLSGVVGVSNIMLITVRERIHEFGIRKALGATPWAIIKLVIVESIVITAFFGYIGMLCGIAACQIMDSTIGQQVLDIGVQRMYIFKDSTVSVGVAIGATVVLIVAGVLAGLFPARKAARVKPIEALNELK